MQIFVKTLLRSSIPMSHGRGIAESGRHRDGRCRDESSSGERPAPQYPAIAIKAHEDSRGGGQGQAPNEVGTDRELVSGVSNGRLSDVTTYSPRETDLRGDSAVNASVSAVLQSRGGAPRRDVGTYRGRASGMMS